MRRLPEALEVWETQSASIEVKFSAKQQCEAMIAAEIKRECSQGGLKLTWDVGRYWESDLGQGYRLYRAICLC